MAPQRLPCNLFFKMSQSSKAIIFIQLRCIAVKGRWIYFSPKNVRIEFVFRILYFVALGFEAEKKCEIHEEQFPADDFRDLLTSLIAPPAG